MLAIELLFDPYMSNAFFQGAPISSDGVTKPFYGLKVKSRVVVLLTIFCGQYVVGSY